LQRDSHSNDEVIRDLRNKLRAKQDEHRLTLDELVKSRDEITKLEGRFSKSQIRINALQDTDARFARLEENQAVALIAAIRVAFFASSFGALSWGIALSVDIPVDAGWLYYSAIVFFFVASVVFFVLGFIFKITWLEPLRKLIAPAVNWFKRRRRRKRD